MKLNNRIIHYVKHISIICLFLLSFSLKCYSYVQEKTIYTTLNSTFYISPWSDRGSGYSGYTCTYTYCYAENSNAFSINVSSQTSTTYTSESGIQHGYYATYSVKALQTGNYIIYGGSECVKSVAGGWTYGNPVIKYHIVVSNPPPTPQVVSITIPNNVSLSVGEIYEYSPVIYEAGASTTLSWKSSQPSIVSVNDAGVINALSIGNSVITCTASNGVSASSEVSVHPKYVSSISLNISELTIAEGDVFTMEATVLPEDAENKQILWNSSDNKIAFVSNEGILCAASVGYCYVTASSTDGSNISANCLVHVVPGETTTKTMALAMKLVKGAIALQVGGSVTLAPLYQPLGVTTDEVTWSTSDPAVATVDTEGTVTPLAEGEAIITATSKIDAELSAECRVKVFEGDGGGVDEGVSTDYGGMFSAPARRSVFDVQGHRLPEPRKGAVNIIGGNKVYVK
ncbi:MAG: Ig domain-containing protein [Prevotella sp.]|nr:Ig domain-containing protein [Prevotella sp.]